jgi:hypothetical protein
MRELSPFGPVEDRRLSPTDIHAGNRAAKPFRAIVPEVHNAYDFYERIYLNA